MVDKVKPLGFETSIDGSQDLPLPTEFNPNEDYLAVKGIAFENQDTFRAEKVGGMLALTVPDSSFKPSFFTSGPNIGELEFLELFEGATQTTPNRRARIDMTYDGSQNPTIEVLKVYDPADGTTILRTITLTLTWVTNEITKITEVTT